MRWDEVKEEHIEAAARWIARALKGKDDALSFHRAPASHSLGKRAQTSKSAGGGVSRARSTSFSKN